MPPTVHLYNLTAPTLIYLVVIKEVEKDDRLKKIIADLEKEEDTGSKYPMQQGMLRYKNRLVIFKSSKLIPTILHTYHDSVFGGHLGFLRTYKRLTGELYWERMKQDVKKYCEEYMVCQRNKSLALAPVGLLLPLEIPNSVWNDISMDFIEGLLKASGFEVILVVVNRFSKYAHLLVLKHPYTTKAVANLFVKEVVRLHGHPHSIVSDRDKVFLSNFWKELFRLVGTRLN